jgi:hypothetical protein
VVRVRGTDATRFTIYMAIANFGISFGAFILGLTDAMGGLPSIFPDRRHRGCSGARAVGHGQLSAPHAVLSQPGECRAGI